jgi:signal transduction histidine kinase
MEKTRAAMFASPHMALLTPLFESIPDQVIVVDGACELLFMNRSFVVAGIERFGTTFVVAKSVCNEKKKSAIVDKAVWSRVLSGEEFVLTEEQGARKNNRLYYEIRFVPIMSDKSKVLGAAAFIKDVSLLRKAEIDLIENRITLQETQAIAGISRWSFSIDGTSADWDDAFASIFGLTPNATKDKKTLFSIFSEDEQKNLQLSIETTRRLGREDIVIDSAFKHPKSGKRYIHTLGRINGDQFIGVSHDITDIKAAQVALETQNKELENTKRAMLNVLEDAQLLEQKTREKVYQLNAILSSMREGLVAVDGKMRIVLMNQAAAALFRIAPDDAIGKPVDKVCVFFQRETKLTTKDTPLKKAIMDNTIMSYSINDNLSILDQSKLMIPVACTASSLSGDLPVKGIMIIRDITKEKEIDSAKNELISLASHQLRTPLSSVNWYSEMLLSGDAGPTNEEQKSYISEIYKGNQRMIALVNALLNVSRVDLGTLTIDAEDVSLKEIGEGVVADQAPLIKEKEIVVKLDIPAKVSKYSGDKNILMIIFQNLISNAVKYTPDNGAVKIKVEIKSKGEIVSEHELKQDSMVLSVTDNGYGIPEKEKNKIFTKLYRANNVKEMETDGNGLGLYLVKTMIENIGGSIWFNSKEKEGTTFYVALPATGMKKKVGTTIFT